MLTKYSLFQHLALSCWLSYLLAEHESPWEWVSGLGAAWPGLVARHYYHSCQVPTRLCTSHSQDSHRHCQVFSRKWIVSIDRIIAVIEHFILMSEQLSSVPALVHTPVTTPQNYPIFTGLFLFSAKMFIRKSTSSLIIVIERRSSLGRDKVSTTSIF